MLVIHSKIWIDRLGYPDPGPEVDFIDDPDPGDDPPDCDECGLDYAIPFGDRNLCGICIGRQLMALRNVQQQKRKRRASLAETVA